MQAWLANSLGVENEGDVVMLWSRRRTLLGLAFAISAAFMVLAGIPRSHAAEGDASQILKAMSDYLASQKTISAALLPRHQRLED